MLSEGFPKCLRIGMEGEGQDRRVVVASLIYGLREGLHGEGGGLTSGSEGGRRSRGQEGQAVGEGGGSFFGCANPGGFWGGPRTGCWSRDWVWEKFMAPRVRCVSTAGFAVLCSPGRPPRLA